MIYKAVQASMPNKDGKKLYHHSLVKFNKVVTTQGLGEEIAKKASLTPGDVHNVIRNLMEVMRDKLLNSQSVKLDGLGSFTMIAHSRGYGVELEKDVNPSQIKYLKCQFTPEYKQADGSSRTRALTTGVEYVHINTLAKSLAGIVDVVDPDTDNSGGGNDIGGGGSLG